MAKEKGYAWPIVSVAGTDGQNVAVTPRGGLTRTPPGAKRCGPGASEPRPRVGFRRCPSTSADELEALAGEVVVVRQGAPDPERSHQGEAEGFEVGVGPVVSR